MFDMQNLLKQAAETANKNSQAKQKNPAGTQTNFPDQATTAPDTGSRAPQGGMAPPRDLTQGVPRGSWDSQADQTMHAATQRPEPRPMPPQSAASEMPEQADQSQGPAGKPVRVPGQNYGEAVRDWAHERGQKRGHVEAKATMLRERGLKIRPVKPARSRQTTREEPKQAADRYATTWGRSRYRRNED